MMRKIMGKNTVEEVTTYQSRRVVSITTSSKELLNDYQRKGFKVKLVEKQEMNRTLQSDSHQGIMAEVLDEEHAFKDCIQALRFDPRSAKHGRYHARMRMFWG
jgi:tRNA G18 (ribose-2'-O)-methylase SpoU